MLELKLRQEFMGRRMQGTAIELSNDHEHGGDRDSGPGISRNDVPNPRPPESH